jgi:gluconolactonase
MNQLSGWTRRSALAFTGAGLAALATRGLAAGPEPHFEVMADGLGFSEGPVVMPDGSVLVVDLISANITRVWKGGKEVVKNIGGGPNGAQLGPDGALYVCNNGGGDPNNHSLADPSQPGRVERLDLATGKVERLFDKVGDVLLSAPNDLVFDAEGGFWFTDYGKTLAECYSRGGLYYCSPDRSTVKAITRNGTGFNGVGLSPDGKTLYFCKYVEGRLMRMNVTGPGEVEMVGDTSRPHIELVGSGLGASEFDGLAITAAGNICIGTNHTGGITTITPDGEVSFFDLPESMVTNIAFGGDDMRDAYLTWSTSGRLVRMRWDEPGLKLNFG